LVMPATAPAARKLPGGGWLRLVKGPSPSLKGAAAPVAPPPPAAPSPPLVAVQAPAAEPSGQLDLLSWRPRPDAPHAPEASPPSPAAPPKRLSMEQLSLFGLDFDPEPTKP